MSNYGVAVFAPVHSKQRLFAPRRARAAVGRIGTYVGRLSSLIKVLYSLTDLPIGRLGRITLTYNIKISRRRVVVRRKQRGERAKKAPNPPNVELSHIINRLSPYCVRCFTPTILPENITVVTGCFSCRNIIKNDLDDTVYRYRLQRSTMHKC